jgi:hypothetical protein
MDSENPTYIEYLSSYLENGDLHYVIENYDNNRNDTLLLIKQITLYKCSTNEEKSQCLKNRLSELFESSKIFKTVIVICIFKENTIEHLRLEDNLPKFNYFFGGYYYWPSTYSLINKKFIEDVENLLSTVYLKPAKLS